MSEDEFMNDMEDEIDPEEEGGATPDDIFAELDAQVRVAVPEGVTITFRVESGAPLYVPLQEGETGITIAQAITRRGLTVSPATLAMVESNPVPFETFVPANTVVTLIGMVKGG
jgi:hypothetical protein